MRNREMDKLKGSCRHTHSDEADRNSKTTNMPHFVDKLHFLLRETGRNQAWLAQTLGVKPPSISQSKTAGKLPTDQVADFCTAFSITTELLELNDFDAFKTAVRARLATKQGIKWRALVERHMKMGLRLRNMSKPAKKGLGLKGVSRRLTIANEHIRRQPIVTLYDRIAFALPNELLDVHDRNGRVTACLIVECDGDYDVLMPDDTLSGPFFTKLEVVFNTDDGQGFYVGDPIGQHRAVALVVAEFAVPALPKFGELGSGAVLDDLAAELSKHSLSQFSLVGTDFFVKPR